MVNDRSGEMQGLEHPMGDLHNAAKKGKFNNHLPAVGLPAMPSHPEPAGSRGISGNRNWDEWNKQYSKAREADARFEKGDHSSQSKPEQPQDAMAVRRQVYAEKYFTISAVPDLNAAWNLLTECGFGDKNWSDAVNYLENEAMRFDLAQALRNWLKSKPK